MDTAEHPSACDPICWIGECLWDAGLHHARAFHRPMDELLFGSKANLEAALHEVGSAICFSFAGNRSRVGDPDFLLPLIRSLACGSGFYREGANLEVYLAKVSRQHFEMCEFREDLLKRLWVGGNFGSDELGCLV